MGYCTNCGNRLAGTPRFCAKCGTQVGQAGDPAPSTRGARVGHFVLVATQVTPRGELLLDVTLVLGKGQITAHGIEEPPDTAGTIAITGGTGLYQSAGGQVRFRDTSGTTTLLQVVIER